MQRYGLINDLIRQAVERAINRLRANSELCRLRQRRARAHGGCTAIWFASTPCWAQRSAIGCSVVTVQTPVLGLVVRRDEEIEKFRRQRFVRGRRYRTPMGGAFCRHLGAERSPNLTRMEEGRLLLVWRARC